MTTPPRRWPAALLATLLTGCSGLLFVPMKPLVRTPADIGLQYRDVALTAADGTPLSAWWLPARGPAKGTVLFLHGNAENISTHIGSVYWLPAEGYQVLLLDYRGFGQSAGKPLIPEVFADIRAALDWLGKEPAARDVPLFLLGQSLGASLGGYLAGADAALRARFKGVVLDAGFARYSWIAREAAAQSWLTWSLQWPIAWSMPDGYDLVDQVGRISPVPLLLIHGTQDEIVDYRHARALFEAAREPRFLLSYDGPHIGSFQDPGIRAALLGFFAAPASGGRAVAPSMAREPQPPVSR
jgi:alpha-beta hydrolase superfamily lysophospholipase